MGNFTSGNINMDMITELIITYGIKFALAIVIFVVGRWAAKTLTNVLVKMMEKAKIDKTLVSFSKNISYTLMLVFVVIAALGQLGVETTSIAAVIAAAGLAVGLALQGSLSNLAAGVMIVLFRPFRVGDFIDAAGTSGTVEDLNIFTTTLKTTDNKAVIIPNSKITDGNITNFSANPTRRIELTFGIGYDDDLKATKKLLQKLVKADKRILKEPEPFVAVSELADSSVNFIVRVWVERADFGAVKHDLLEKVKLEFDKAGISIPYPQQDIHIHAANDELKKNLAA